MCYVQSDCREFGICQKPEQGNSTFIIFSIYHHSVAWHLLAKKQKEICQ